MLSDKFSGLIPPADDILKRFILPYIFCVTLSVSVLDVYGEGGVSVYSLYACGVALFVFLLLEFVKRHKYIGGLIYVLICFVVLRIFGGLVSQGDFSGWFFAAGDGYSEQVGYYIAIAVGFSFFFSSAVFYFTSIRYRASYLMLLSLVPCLLYVKVVNNISGAYLSVIIALNILLMLLNRTGTTKRSGRMPGAMPAALLCAAVMLVASLIPRPSNTLYYDTFERLFSIGGGLSQNNFSYITTESGDASSYRNLQNVKLYDVEADETLYFARQWFDYYVDANNRWYMLGRAGMPMEEYLSRQQLLSYDRLLAAYRAADEYESGFAERFGLSELLQYDGNTFDGERLAILLNSGVDIGYFMSMTRMIGISAGMGVGGNGEIYASANRRIDYMITYYEDVSSAAHWQAEGGMDITYDDFISALRSAEEILLQSGNEEALATVRAYLYEIEQAEQVAEQAAARGEVIPERIRELALEVTEGCVYDYEKAEALRLFFDEGGFVYNIEYIPPDDSIEYFLFESKTGTCSEYATAYALMAKAVGLHVRYTEGFVSDISPNGEYPYQIRTTGSHAYPQVFISGAGWIIYEPTPATYRRTINDINLNDIVGDMRIDIDVTAIISFGVAAVVLAVVVMALSKYLAEGIFIIRVRFSDESKGVVLIYNRLRRLLFGRSSVTAGEVAAAVSGYGADASFIGECFEPVCYGGRSAAEGEKRRAYECYRICKKNKRAADKKRRK